MFRLLSQIVFFCVMSVSALAQEPQQGPRPIYDELASAEIDVAAAKEQADREGKFAMLVFGANWCGDCRNFEAEMNTPQLGSVIAEHYVVVKIDVARFKKNTELGTKYGISTWRGIPAVAVLGRDGKPILSADGRKIATLRKFGLPETVKYFDTLAINWSKNAQKSQ
jgi:thioredoxin 1